MNVHFTTLGCKLNQAETEHWIRQSAAAGYQVVDSPEGADLCIVHSCTVTQTASRKSRQVAHQMGRNGKGRRIVLTGCYAELLRQQGRNLDGVDLLVGTAEKDRLLDVIREYSLAPQPVPWFHNGAGSDPHMACPAPPDPEVVNRYPVPRTRAFVKVQDGCNMRCAFCIIPFTRGAERSRPVADIVREIDELVAAGHQEVLITGVQISVYGRDRREWGLGLRDLIATILVETEVPRLRVSSIAPWDLDAELLALWESPRLCRHLHLSLQSGCDATLQRMRRPYTAARFTELMDMARRMIPGVAITTDVIVGFPGETDAEFEASRRFVEEAEFARVHVFPYSPRPGTAAATMPGQVHPHVVRERVGVMGTVAEESARRFAQQFVGETLDVLWEQPEGDACWSGYTDNYIRVVTRHDKDLSNVLAPTRLIESDTDSVWGEVLAA